MKMKKWYKSKTLMLNLVAATFAALSMLDKAVLNAIGITNTEAFLSVVGFLTTTGNIYLRLFQSQDTPLYSKKSKESCEVEESSPNQIETKI